MTPLHSLQSQFQTALLQQRALAPGVLSARGVLQWGVYENAYRARLRAALRDNFEILPRVMGDEAFDALADAYIAAHPSRHYSLRWYGHLLCDFMAASEALVEHPALIDLARMQWALRTAFDAADAPTLTAAELSAVPAADWGDLRLTLHPSVQLLPLQWAVGPIWHTLQSEPDDIAPPAALVHHMLVWRQGMGPRWKSLTASETVFVQCLLAGRPFAQVCAALCQYVAEHHAAATAVALLHNLLHSGTIGALAPRTFETTTP